MVHASAHVEEYYRSIEGDPRTWHIAGTEIGSTSFQCNKRCFEEINKQLWLLSMQSSAGVMPV